MKMFCFIKVDKYKYPKLSASGRQQKKAWIIILKTTSDKSVYLTFFYITIYENFSFTVL